MNSQSNLENSKFNSLTSLINNHQKGLEKGFTRHPYNVLKTKPTDQSNRSNNQPTTSLIQYSEMNCLRVGPVVQFGEMDRSRIGPPLNRLNQGLNHKPNEPSNFT